MSRRATTPPGVRSSWLVAVALALEAAALGCGSAPPRPAPHRETILGTEYEDARVGRDATREIVAEMGMLSDPALQAFVERLGQRLVRHAPARPFTYRFHVLDQWSPNAFALPGGVIFVSRGLLALSNSEDELANVLAHEITHAAERHAAGRQAWEQQLNPFSLGLLRLAHIAAYARDQERAADRGGQRLAASAGYDPRGMTDFLDSLGDVERLLTGRRRLPTFLDTHPAATERLATTSAYAQSLSWRRSPGEAGDRTGYLRRLEGLVVDDDPAEGVFRGNRFLHPDLEFAVSFPDGWTILNTHTAVVALSPARDARFSLEFAGEGDDPRVPAGAFLADRARDLNARIEEAQSLSLACCPAYQLRGHVDVPGGPISGQLTWIAYGGNVYRLGAAARSQSARAYFGRANAMVRSFRPLGAEERDSIEVDRLRVAAARAGETLTEFSRRTGNALDVQRTAVANNLPTTARLEAGQLLKIARREIYRPGAPSAGAASTPVAP